MAAPAPTNGAIAASSTDEVPVDVRIGARSAVLARRLNSKKLAKPDPEQESGFLGGLFGWLAQPKVEPKAVPKTEPTEPVLPNKPWKHAPGAKAKPAASAPAPAPAAAEPEQQQQWWNPLSWLFSAPKPAKAKPKQEQQPAFDTRRAARPAVAQEKPLQEDEHVMIVTPSRTSGRDLVVKVPQEEQPFASPVRPEYSGRPTSPTRLALYSNRSPEYKERQRLNLAATSAELQALVTQRKASAHMRASNAPTMYSQTVASSNRTTARKSAKSARVPPSSKGATPPRGGSWLGALLGPETKQTQSEEPKLKVDEVLAAIGDGAPAPATDRVAASTDKSDAPPADPTKPSDAAVASQAAAETSPPPQQQQRASYRQPFGGGDTDRVSSRVQQTPKGSRSYGVQSWMAASPKMGTGDLQGQPSNRYSQESSRSTITQHHEVWLDVVESTAARGLPPQGQMQQIQEGAPGEEVLGGFSARESVRPLTEREVRNELERLARLQRARLNWRQAEDEKNKHTPTAAERKEARQRLYVPSPRHAPDAPPPRVYYK